MTTFEILRIVARVEVVLATLPLLGCVWMILKTPWRETPLGKHLMAFTTSLAAVFFLTILSWPLRGSIGFMIVYVVVFTTLPIVMWWRFAEQWKAHRDDRRAERIGPT
jgi:hypothetical protein